MANIKINNLKELEELLIGKIEEAMKGIAKSGENTVKTFVDVDVYESYTSDEDTGYKRTGELKSSVTSMVSKVEEYAVEAKIYHDTFNLMGSYPRSSVNNWIGQHHSVVKKYIPQDYRDYIIQTVNKGISEGKKKIFGDGVYSKARPYMDNARRSLSKDANGLMMNELKKLGVKAYIY
jgi:hypothetical protein